MFKSGLGLLRHVFELGPVHAKLCVWLWIVGKNGKAILIALIMVITFYKRAVSWFNVEVFVDNSS